jgi:hypothetical protein
MTKVGLAIMDADLAMQTPPGERPTITRVRQSINYLMTATGYWSPLPWTGREQDLQ